VDGGHAAARQSVHHLSIGAANIRVHDIHGSYLQRRKAPIVRPRPPGGVIAIPDGV
jgi:hypothetical protein